MQDCRLFQSGAPRANVPNYLPLRPDAEAFGMSTAAVNYGRYTAMLITRPVLSVSRIKRRFLYK
jgi:hypothetical protein